MTKGPCVLLLIAFILNPAAVVAAPASFLQEEVHYRNVKLEDCDCHVGVLYGKRPENTSIAVSAVATGKGAEFRKWEISAIRLFAGGERVWPDSEDRFFVRKENFFRVPAAVLFAVIGGAAGYHMGGTGLEKGIGAAGMAVGLGLLVMAAKGEIDGTKSSFVISNETAAGLKPDRDYVEITAENEDMHLKERFRIALVRPLYAPGPSGDYKMMSKAQLGTALNGMRDRLEALETEQSSLREGDDPEYDRIQKEIDALQTERGIAYTMWLEKKDAN